MPAADRNCIVAMCRKYPPREFEDLMQEAQIAYWLASQRYDEGRKVTLRTYAMRRVKGALIDWLRRTDFRPRSRLKDGKSTVLIGLMTEDEMQQPVDTGATPDQQYIIDVWERDYENCSSRRRRKHRKRAG